MESTESSYVSSPEQPQKRSPPPPASPPSGFSDLIRAFFCFFLKKLFFHTMNKDSGFVIVFLVYILC